MSKPVRTSVQFEIAGELLTAVVFGRYQPGSRDTWNKQIGTWEPGDREMVEDVSIESLRFEKQDADTTDLTVPEWLSDLLLRDGEADAALIREANEPPDDPPERDDRP